MKINRKTLNSLLCSGVLVAACLAAGPTRAQNSPVRNIHVGLFYPISTNGTGAPSDTNAVSLNMLAGISAEETAFSFAGITQVIRHNASGVQFAGFSNHIGGRSEGLLFGGFANTYREGAGLQFAGFTNVARKEVSGGQFAGFANRAAAVDGFQFAGFTNAAGDVTGSQFGGFANTSDDIDGSQFAGFINTAGDVRGSQFAGFINIARKVKGAQFAGFINVADSSDNPIGIVNIIRKGEIGLGVTLDENATSLLSLRSGGRNLYGILGAGYNLDRTYRNLYALEAGFGGHVHLTNHFRLNGELVATALHDFRFTEFYKGSARVLPAIKLFHTIELFGGPAFTWVHHSSPETMDLVPRFIHERKNRNGRASGYYIGYAAGLHFFL
ncbi:MAG TPA: hypothetical protein VGE15_02655 [Sphingobacteriaceae bacterium]